MRGLLFGLLIASCGGPSARVSSEQSPSSQASSQEVRATMSTDGRCVTVNVFEGGVDRGAICATEAMAKGMTLVDLTDTWTPGLFQPADGQTPSFHDRYLQLAHERDQDGKSIEGEDALDELYGVVPALSIVESRLADDQRHQCDEAIDPKPILALDKTLSQDYKNDVAMADQARQVYAAQFEKERVRRKLADATPLATDPVWKDRYARWQKLDAQHTALVTAEQKLRCEGWLIDKDTDGSFTWRTGNAVEMFQRRNFLMPTERLDKETREAMQIPAKELDYRLALRVLRERVVDAAGIVEDGTASTGPLPVLGRMLDPEDMRAARGQTEPMANGAPDLVSPATETAAKALGWIGPDETRAWLQKHPAGARVAIVLPPLPAYHAPHMELSAEIDRGDVWYDEQPPLIRRIVKHRPNLVLFVDDHGTKRALVRWPTTIGGWADQRLPDGSLVQRWKESDVGPRVWRDIFAGPTWFAPKTTPDRELVKNLWNGHWGLKSEELGPGPHAAYGMVLIEHLQVIKQKDGTERLDDNGIGTHGSASVTSIVNGTSHGCHRLYNQLAVRLGDFLLRHRNHVVKGEKTDEHYRRFVRHNNEVFKASIDTRGFAYELTPPVAVNVLQGNILSTRKVPPRALAPARP
ncbi:MAG: peptidoglycan-binding domain-containing protein [Kofleriaceae bacterium]